jgi:hypothetical protein
MEECLDLKGIFCGCHPYKVSDKMVMAAPGMREVCPEQLNELHCSWKNLSKELLDNLEAYRGSLHLSY